MGWNDLMRWESYPALLSAYAAMVEGTKTNSPPVKPAILTSEAWVALARSITDEKGSLYPLQTALAWGTYELATIGAKVYRPTSGEWGAFGDIEMRIEFDEYKQPFSTVVIEVPPEVGLCFPPMSGDRIMHDFGIASDRTPVHCVVVRKGDGVDRIRLTFLGMSGTDQDSYCIPAFPVHIGAKGRTDGTLEELLNLEFYRSRDAQGDSLVGSYQNEWENWVRTQTRKALNACLFLANFGMKRLGRTDEAGYATAERISRNKNVTDEWREHNRLKAALIPEVFTIDQHIDLREATEVPREHRDSSPTGTMPPHWRRAHWAMQAHGPNHTLRKMVFRKAAFVNRHRFGGDGLDSTTTYQ